MTALLMTRWGAGYHVWDVPRDDYYRVLKWLYAGAVIYIPMAYSTKVALLLLIARVFSINRRFAKGIYIFIIALGIAYIPLQIAKILMCIPVAAYWNPDIPNAKCLNYREVFVADLSVAIFTDFFILFAPVPLTWKLSMPLRKKIKIVLLLGAGGCATSVTIYRTYKVVKFQHSEDVTSDFVMIDVLT